MWATFLGNLNAYPHLHCEVFVPGGVPALVDGRLLHRVTVDAELDVDIRLEHSTWKHNLRLGNYKIFGTAKFMPRTENI